MKKLIGRLKDWRLERRIKHHSDACKVCLTLSNKVEARKHWHAMAALLLKRSPTQVARMERARGLR